MSYLSNICLPHVLELYCFIFMLRFINSTRIVFCVYCVVNFFFPCEIPSCPSSVYCKSYPFSTCCTASAVCQGMCVSVCVNERETAIFFRNFLAIFFISNFFNSLINKLACHKLYLFEVYNLVSVDMHTHKPSPQSR